MIVYPLYREDTHKNRRPTHFAAEHYFYCYSNTIASEWLGFTGTQSVARDMIGWLGRFHHVPGLNPYVYRGFPVLGVLCPSSLRCMSVINRGGMVYILEMADCQMVKD